MDVQMPEMDGIETTRRIREADDEKIRNTKIIAMTAYAMPEDRERLLEAGMDEYLSKPVDLQTLADTLKEMRRN
jgi:CheY-like chemotaxis protein